MPKRKKPNPFKALKIQRMRRSLLSPNAQKRRKVSAEILNNIQSLQDKLSSGVNYKELNDIKLRINELERELMNLGFNSKAYDPPNELAIGRATFVQGGAPGSGKRR